jgi:phosphoglycolate phosphatase-like HAD superfamily hydrolase
VSAARALALDLDALGDTRALWSAWLGAAQAVLEIDPASLPADRGEAAAALDRSAAGNWRVLLERFSEDHAPAYLRRDAAASAVLRSLASTGTAVGVFTDAPAELAQVALAQLGATRRVTTVESGTGALQRLLASLGADAEVVRTRDDLLAHD